jgi:hypothetical protein
MRLIGYTRTKLKDEVGEQDLEEQERVIAEFCTANAHELYSFISDEEGRLTGLEEALKTAADGLVITDALVIADDTGRTDQLFQSLEKTGKHLFIVYHGKHIDPAASGARQELVDSCKSLITTDL